MKETKNFKRLVTFAIAMTLCLTALAIVPTVSAATVYYVSTTGDNANTGLSWADAWRDIQYAVDNVGSGDTVHVAAGTYNENIIIDKSLTVVSVEGSEVTIINAQVVGFGVLIHGTGTVVTFDGFTVENYKRVGILAGSFSLAEEDPDVVHILNNIVKEPIGEQNNNCIQIGDGTTGTVIGNEVMGASLESPDWTGSGILVAGSSNVVISNNYAHDCESGIVIVGYAEYRDAPAINNLIEDNLVEDSGTGISVQMYSIGTIIRYNDVLNNDGGIAVMAIDYSWPEHSTPSGTEIHFNNIVGNVNYGVKSGLWGSDTGEVLAEEVDATYNWWGHATGADHISNPHGTGQGGDAVSDNVDFIPWYATSTTTPSTEYVTVAHNPVIAVSDTIQGGIDAAVAGDTVTVAAGTYSGAVVDKQVSIIGASGGSSIITSGVPYKAPTHAFTTGFRLDSGADGTEITDFTINCDVTSNFYFAVFGRGVDDVVIDSFEINDAIQGITNWGGNNWEITNNILTDTVAAGGGGIGIFLGATPPTYRECSGNLVQYNTIYADGTEVGYTSPGICLCLDVRGGSYGALDTTEELTNNQIIDNSITGTGNANEVGIEVGVIGVSGDPVKVAYTMGMVHDNYVQDNTVDGSDYGIYAYVVEDLAIERNEIKNCVTHGISIRADFTGNINCNEIYGNANYGLYYDLTSTVDATCNWWGHPSGPYHPTSNPNGQGDVVSDNVDYDPWAGKVIGPTDPVPLVDGSATVSLTGYFTCNMDTATFDWGDGSSLESTDLSPSDTSITGSHTYTEAGVYTVTLTIDDDNSWSITMKFQYVVVYDPDAGFVTGGGWINSPIEAYRDDPSLTGKANFGFVSKYKKGQSTPTGNTQFQFKAGDLNFHSSEYDWMVIAGAKAMYKGTGTINNAGTYKFIITAWDGISRGTDRFRIKIWYEDNGNEIIIYDNGTDTPLGGGQIKIHQK